MSKLYEVPAGFAARTRIRHDDYVRMYEESVRDPEGFWSRMGQRIDWVRPYTKVKDVSYDARDFRIRWYHDGQLNVSANCLDRHLAERGDKTAILWGG
jgi:acetyl-CoA synthetase